MNKIKQKKMKYCKNCGQQAADKSCYCSSCGEYFSEEGFSEKNFDENSDEY